MKFLDKKSSRFYHRTAKAVALLTLVAIIVPFSLFAPIPAHAAAEDSLGCGISSTLDPAVCLANVVYVFTVGLGSGLAYVSAFILDTTVSLSLNSAAYALSFLSAGWTTARDLANMAFILILVYIAFMIMFQSETAGTMRMLAWVIFIALIINFSFFFTRVVIDASNILAVQFYNSIGVGPNGQTVTMAQTFTATNSGTGTLANAATGAVASVVPDSTLQNTKDLTASIMSALNVQQFFSNQSFKDFSKNSGFGSKFITLSFLYLAMGACYFILAAMFLAVGIKFLMRIVVLWFLIIASPLAFISKAVPNNPQISGWYDKWQHELISHAFYPAFFLFIFFFISSIMSGLNGNGGILGGLANDLGKLSTNDNLGSGTYVASLIAVIAIRLGFVIAALYIALKASEYMGVKGSEVAHRMTSYAFSKTGQIAAFPVGYAGRQTFGRAGTALANNGYLATRAVNAPALLKGTLRGIDRGSKAVGNTLGKASYDPRNAPGASILKKGVEKISGGSVNAGSPDKGGFMAQAKERDDRRKAEEKEEKRKDREKELNVTIKELAEKSARHDELEAKEKAGTITAPERNQMAALKHQMTAQAGKINGLSKGEFENYKMPDIQKVIKHLSKDTVKKINESDKYSEKEKETVRMEHDLKMQEKQDAETKAKREEIGLKSVEKSQEIIDELRNLHKSLAVNGNIMPKAMERIERATAAGKELNLKVIKDASNEAKELRILAEGAQSSNTSKYEKEKAQYVLTKLNEVIPHLEKLKGHVDEIPETIGGTPNPKEFIMA